MSYVHGSLNEHAERPDKAACVIRPLTQSVWTADRRAGHAHAVDEQRVEAEAFGANGRAGVCP